MARVAKPKYRVLVWRADVRRYVPAANVRPGPYGLFALRKALRRLVEMGHSLGSGHGVLVERIDVAREGRPARGKVIED